jgi:acetyl-CoA carboxylase biotin carboxyl carrier protein
MSTADPQVPTGVTFREAHEIIRTFQRSGWTGMTLELRGLRITVGKDGAPAGAAGTVPSAPPAAAPGVASPAPADVVSPPPAVPVVSPPPAAGPVGSPPSGVVDTAGCVAVRSPAVGAFWAAPSPGRAPFVRVGQTVERDEQLAIVEVMKLMNPVVATVPGEVVDVCAKNAEMVEYDQVLFWIRPSDG